MSSFFGGGGDAPTSPINRLGLATNLPAAPGVRLSQLPQIQIPNFDLLQTPEINFGRQQQTPGATGNPQPSLISLLQAFQGGGSI